MKVDTWQLIETYTSTALKEHQVADRKQGRIVE